MLAPAPKRCGLTLAELVVVVVIMVALAGLLIPQLAQTTDQTRIRTTLVTMNKLRDVLVGTPSTPGYFQDMDLPPTATGSVQNLDVYMEDLYWNPAATSYSVVYTNTFDPNAKLGWRGPYLTNSGGAFNTAALDPSFASYVRPRGGWTPPIPAPPAVLDAWGNPIVLQWPLTSDAASTRATYVRLVSAGPPSANTAAGPRSVIDTPNTSLMPTPDLRRNDLVLFLRVADPYGTNPLQGANP